MLSGRAGGGLHYVADNASRQGAFRGHGMCVSSFCHSFIQSLAGIYVLGGSYHNSGEREGIQKNGEYLNIFHKDPPLMIFKKDLKQYFL